MTEELKQLREALRRVKHEAASLADAQVIALEALTQRPAAQAGAREAFESVLIDGVAYDVHAPVAAELLRLHIELQALPTQLAQNDAFFVLDDEAKAMIVNSHHYTPADIRALIERFKSFADPEQTDLADWDNLDWRGLCNVTWRVMMGLACDLSPSATPEPVGDVRCDGCGYMTHHREHMGCVRAAKQHTRPAPGVPEGSALFMRALLQWAVGRWQAEVQDRPMVNKNRRTLDDTWRQVIRFAGGNPDALVGPSHDDMLAAAQAKGADHG